MPAITIVTGIILALYGLYSYTTSESHSPTALIPAGFGAAFLVLGLLALKDTLRKHAMHLAAVIGSLGFLGGAGMGLPKLPKLFAGELDQKGQNAAQSQILLGIVCLAFVILCVNSFIQARKRRRQGQAYDSAQVPK